MSELRSCFNTPNNAKTGVFCLDESIDHYRPPLPESEHNRNRIFLESDDEYEDEFASARNDLRHIEPLDRSSRKSAKQTKSSIIHLVRELNSNKLAHTVLIHELLSASVLAAEHGGQYGVAVLIDCSGFFDPLSLHRVMLHRANQAIDKTIQQASIDNENSDDIVDVKTADRESDARSSLDDEIHDRLAFQVKINQALQNVHILKCDSSMSLLTTLQALPTYLTDYYQRMSVDHRPLSSLIVADINQFYWQDRADAELARLNRTDVNRDLMAQAGSGSLSTRILKELKSVQGKLECGTVVYTTTRTSSVANSSTPGTNPGQLTAGSSPSTAPNPSFDIYSHSALFTVQTSHETPLPSMHRDLRDCLADRERRSQAIKTQRYWFSANPGGMADQRDRTGNATKYFSMHVDENGEFVFQ